MAKKVLRLDFVDIVMGARADVIKEAYEARLKIDGLLDAREEAYMKIAQIENEVEEIVGVNGEFVFPAPPLPVAGMPKPSDSVRARKAVKKAEPEETQPSENAPSETLEDNSAPAADENVSEVQSGTEPENCGSNDDSQERKTDETAD